MSVLIALRKGSTTMSVCNERCYNAKTKNCGCICNGLNHGVGRTMAIKHTREAGTLAVAAYVVRHPFAKKWKSELRLPISTNEPSKRH